MASLLFQMFFFIVGLQLGLVIARLDEGITWPWGIVLIPSFILCLLTISSMCVAQTFTQGGVTDVFFIMALWFLVLPAVISLVYVAAYEASDAKAAAYPIIVGYILGCGTIN